MTTSWIQVDRQITGENSTNGHPQRIYRRSSPHLQLKSVEKGYADPGSRCHGDGTHSNDLPGCVMGGVTDITQPRARPGSGRPSSRSRGYHLGMARAPPPAPPPAPWAAAPAPGGPHGLLGAWGGAHHARNAISRFCDAVRKLGAKTPPNGFGITCAQNQIQTFSAPYLLSLRNRYDLAL